MSATILGCAVLLSAHVTRAQNNDERSAKIAADALSDAGIKLFKAHLYAQAYETLAKAYATRPSASIGLWQARSLRELGRLVEAIERLRDVTHLTLAPTEPAAEKKAQATAAMELQTVMRETPTLTVQVKGARDTDIAVTLDGQPVPKELVGQPQPVNPGQHRVEAVRLSDRASTQSDIEAKIAQQNTVVLQFASTAGAIVSPLPNGSTAPLAAPSSSTSPPASMPAGGAQPLAGPPALQTAPSPPTAKTASNAVAQLPSFGLVPLTIQPDSRAAIASSSSAPTKRSTASSVIGYGSLGTGAASLVVGVGAYFVALSKKNELNSSPNCSDYRCSSLEKSNVDSYNQFRTAAIIGLLGGAALVTTGVATLLYPTSTKGERTMAFGVGVGSASITGDF